LNITNSAITRSYLKELAIRWNMRKLTRAGRFDAVLGSFFGNSLTREGLTAK
jgi:hypothetical protein